MKDKITARRSEPNKEEPAQDRRAAGKGKKTAPAPEAVVGWAKSARRARNKS